MPAATPASVTAMQQVLDNLMGLPGSPGVADLDLIFLRGIMESPIVRSLAKAHERLEERKLEAVRGDNLALVQEILRDIGRLARPDGQGAAAELARILREPHFQSLLETHDSVAAKSYDPPPSSPGPEPPLGSQPVPPDAVRMVGIRKAVGENLGVTFRVERGELVIARILHGGMVAQQGLLHVGDVIREVNGREVGSDPRALQDSLRHASGSVVLKILPSYQEPHPPRQVFVKCHFDYDPATDSLIPCKEAGLKFMAGDLLQIVNQDDPNWWQACHVEGGSAGLVPSQLLEEKRKAFVKRDGEVAPTSGALCGSLSGRRKKRMMYVTTKNAEFDRHELLIYEEVARMPPFRRKTLVLIGAQGVGRRSLKNKLIMSDQARYGTTIPSASCITPVRSLSPVSSTILVIIPVPWEHPCHLHISEAKGERAGWAGISFRVPGGDGGRHQGWEVPGARRVRGKPVRNQDRLHPSRGGGWQDVHPGCQPPGSEGAENS
ncbi:PREDICTED: MAGUK p55 subfamily member 2 isoform X3 [Lepidothrix coronata]|uniref:MAGUK p55 subfamily member 2 isoform X3 n=1 Tax=Lepidothrix coronata TaxID=321398 RepID=A0A6J0J5L9_9PASS|nr:PREDICTED: MAGUK p55 subfamily member 2 isoform X3 [Lepidothrix coronata]